MTKKEIIERLEHYLADKNMTVYKLAKQSNLPLSTVNNVFKRKTIPNLITFQSMINGLGISMGEFFDEHEKDTLSNEEKEMIYRYNKLSKKDKMVIRRMLIYLSGQKK